MQTQSIAVAVVICAATSACNQMADVGPPWEWAKAPDASVVNYFGDGQIEALRRCWQREGRNDCLYVNRSGSFYQARRYQMAKLNRGDGDDPTLADHLGGYSCTFTENGTIEEAIAGTGDFLAKNTLNLFDGVPTKPWTASYVSSFMRAKGIERPRSHFDCAELASLALQNGVEAARGEGVSYRQLMH